MVSSIERLLNICIRFPLCGSDFEHPFVKWSVCVCMLIDELLNQSNIQNVQNRTLLAVYTSSSQIERRKAMKILSIREDLI